MPAGELREMVRFERRRQIADDGYGNVLSGWTIIAGPMPARVEPQTGSEDVIAERPTGVQPVAITVRWSKTAAVVEPQDRAVDRRNNRIWNILSVSNNDERKQYLNMIATAGVADG
jgi:head-tail adaptor